MITGRVDSSYRVRSTTINPSPRRSSRNWARPMTAPRGRPRKDTASILTGVGTDKLPFWPVQGANSCMAPSSRPGCRGYCSGSSSPSLDRHQPTTSNGENRTMSSQAKRRCGMRRSPPAVVQIRPGQLLPARRERLGPTAVPRRWPVPGSETPSRFEELSIRPQRLDGSTSPSVQHPRASRGGVVAEGSPRKLARCLIRRR